MTDLKNAQTMEKSWEKAGRASLSSKNRPDKLSLRRRKPIADSGIDSYDAAVVAGSPTPVLSNVHASTSMSSVYQMAPAQMDGALEIEAKPHASLRVLVRLGTQCRIRWTLADRTMPDLFSTGSAIILPATADAKFECDQNAMDGWMHLHFPCTPQMTLRSLRTESSIRQSSTTDHAVYGLACAAKHVTDSGLKPSELLWSSIASAMMDRVFSKDEQPRTDEKRREFLSADTKRRVLEHLKDRIGENFSLESLASEFGYSPSHFARAFRNSVGMPPHRYQTTLRMEKAVHLLHTTTYPIALISDLLGYANNGSFSRAFREEFKLTPSQHRRTR